MYFARASFNNFLATVNSALCKGGYIKCETIYKEGNCEVLERRLTLTEQPVGQELSDEEKTADAPRQNILPSPSNDFEEGSQEDLTAP